MQQGKNDDPRDGSLEKQEFKIFGPLDLQGFSI